MEVCGIVTVSGEVRVRGRLSACRGLTDLSSLRVLSRYCLGLPCEASFEPPTAIEYVPVMA